MSTQHPDNVSTPFFAEAAQIGGEDEIQEAYYAFSHLGCDEQMWDCEGKEVDNFVVKKLLARYGDYFRTHRLGKDVFLTLRVPNPTVEKAEAKVLLETLESIPRSYDAARVFYDDGVPPIFEVILPMTTSAKCLERTYRYYADFVVGKQNRPFSEGDITVAEWIGQFSPQKINVIPLFEDMDHMLQAPTILDEYLKGKDIRHQRVFLARSDPAMNYGIVSAVLLNKIALQRLHRLSEETGVKLYPILGIGPAPLRGNFTPKTAIRVADEYPSVHTFTIQSAFKYDHPPDETREAIEKLKKRKTAAPCEVDEKRCLAIIDKYLNEYQRQIAGLAPVINRVAAYVPSRRKRKLHIGLFGYSRAVRGVTLPRAITFTAALYSIGLPPEVLGLNALTNEDLSFLKGVYPGFEDDIKDSVKYLNPESEFLPKEVRNSLERYGLYVEVNMQHKELTDLITSSLKADETQELTPRIVSAANIRHFLG